VTSSHSYRDTWIEVNLEHIKHNIKSFKQYLPDHVDFMAAVKANGYGHGAVEVAKVALEAGAKGLVVAMLDEALKMREAGYKCPILVLGWVRPQDVQLAIHHNITLTVFQKDWVNEAERYIQSGKLLFHLKVDTGMGRLGTRSFDEAYELIKLTNSNEKFYCEGIFTHYATADEKDDRYFRNQLKKFINIINRFKDVGITFQTIHTSNSAATLQYPEQAFNQVRIGISMYGLSPSKEINMPFELKEALSFHSKVVHVKKLKAGEAVSYGSTFVAKEDVWIGTIPVGYADGWLRGLGNKAEVLIQGERVPIVGNVCMDQFMVRLTNKVSVGEKVTLIGKQGNSHIGIDEIAAHLNTINYEVPCIITSRVPRIYIQ
jgi:alanine racemase